MKFSWCAIALVALVLTAGCVDPTNQRVYVTAEPVSDEAVIEKTTTPVNKTLSEIQTVIRNGGSSDVTEQDDRLADDAIVAAESGYYRINQTVVERVDATQVTYRVTIVDNETADYTFSDLTSEDRRVVAIASILADNDDGTIEGATYTNETELPNSVLADGTQVVAYNGTLYRVEPFASEPAQQPRYVYSGQRVATTDEEYVDYVDETYTVPLTDAPEPARTFFANVSMNGTFSGEGGEGYVRLEEYLSENRTVDTHTWFVRYQGERYELTLEREDFPP